MRGTLPNTLLRQSFEAHGVKTTLCGPPCNFTRLAAHFDKHGEASVCVMIKYADLPTHRFCHGRGALVVLDNVDNFRAFTDLTMQTEAYQSVDAMLVQTRAHAEWLALQHGLRAIVLPHPHGNLYGWAPAPAVRTRLSGVGMLQGDLWRNQPPREELEAIAAASCGMNVSVHMVDSPPGRGVAFRLKPCPNRSYGAQLLADAWMRERRAGEARPSWLDGDDPMAALDAARVACERRTRPAARIWPSATARGRRLDTTTSGESVSDSGVNSGARGRRLNNWRSRVASRPAHSQEELSDAPYMLPAVDASAMCTPPEASLEGSRVARALRTPYGWARSYWPRDASDPTHQRAYYYEPKLHDIVDVGLLWKPGRQTGTPFSIANRPPTRMHWWWSHGVPTFGYPMVAYLEGAERAGYPTELLNVSRVVDLPAALCALADAPTRMCLRSAALRAAALSSPQYSAAELVAALCELSAVCASERRLRPNVAAAATSQARARTHIEVASLYCSAPKHLVKQGAPECAMAPNTTYHDFLGL